MIVIRMKVIHMKMMINLNLQVLIQNHKVIQVAEKIKVRMKIEMMVIQILILNLHQKRKEIKIVKKENNHFNLNPM